MKASSASASRPRQQSPSSGRASAARPRSPGPSAESLTTWSKSPNGFGWDLEWDRRVAGSDLVVLDEAQSWPAIFPRLRGVIDRNRSRKGRYLLLGSVSPSLMMQVSESLAGRLALVELTPFLSGTEDTARTARPLWLHGGFPTEECSRSSHTQSGELASCVAHAARSPELGADLHPADDLPRDTNAGRVHGQVRNGQVRQSPRALLPYGEWLP